MSFSPEDNLILLCSRVRLSDQVMVKAMCLLRQDLDWAYILEASVLHGVAPLFWRGLTQLESFLDLTTVIPPPIRSELDRLYNHNRTRNHRLFCAISEICTAFERSGIQIMALKDLALNKTIYPDPCLRPMGDIDILVHRDDYLRIEKCMADLGFSPVPDPNCPFILKYALAIHFHRLTDNVWVDIQWGILQVAWDAHGMGPFDFDVEPMWRGAQKLMLEGYEILIPRPEEMFYHLCMHLEGHQFSELILFCDIAEFLRRQGEALDWDYTLALADRYGTQASMYYVLFYVQQLLDCPLPVDLQRFKPKYVSGRLIGPLFGNLSDLHTSLDDIHRASDPPAGVMSYFEAIVRRQAAFAVRLYEELDHFSRRLSDRGVSTVIWESAPSSRIFPSQTLSSFAPIHLFLLSGEKERFRQAIIDYGFQAGSDDDRGDYHLSCAFSPVDAAVGKKPLVLELDLRLVKGIERFLADRARQALPKKDLALQALAGARQYRTQEANVRIRVDVVVLSPEELCVCLASLSGQKVFGRLFELCGLLEFFRNHRDRIDWSRAAEIARKHNLERAACAGLLAAEGILGQDMSADPFSSFSACPPPRMLQWARYGSSALDRYTGFKQLFYWVLTFQAIQGFSPELDYLFKKKGLAKFFAYLAQSLIHLFENLLHRKNPIPPRKLAYWAAPEPVPGKPAIDCL